MASGAGFIMDAINTLMRNRMNSSNRKSKYTKLKELYIGEEQSETSYANFSQLPKLSPEELIAGRKRAKAYYLKRNRRIWFQITAVFLGVIILVAVVFWNLLN